MIANCKQNRECLMALLDSIQDGLLSAKECKDINSEYFFLLPRSQKANQINQLTLHNFH